MEKERNILESTFRNLLSNHTLTIGDGTNLDEFYVIEVYPKTALVDDFMATYPDIEEFKSDVAKASLGKDRGRQTYGVIISKQLQYMFAFNRQFAEFKGFELAFETPEDVILSYIRDGAKTKFNFERTDQAIPKDLGGRVSFARPSLLDRVKDYYRQHKVTIDGKEYFLVEFENTSFTFNDIVGTYKKELRDDFKRKIAEAKFKKDKVEQNKYGILFDEEMRMRFAFNTRFANFREGAIVYQPLEELLLSGGKPTDKKELMLPRVDHRKNCSGGRLCYALVGLKD